MSYHINDLMYEYYLAMSGQKGGMLMAAGVAGLPISTKGCTLYHVVVTDLDGSDVLQVEGQMLDGGWTAISDTLTTDTDLKFTGLWDQVRVTKVSGSGETTTVAIKLGVGAGF